MARIKQLPPHEAQKIAAGEVVERPASIVKELVENALDARATKIAVYIENGGRSSIRVVDNGSGMSPEDAHLSIAHHATSKISSVDQLTSIKTFGFRGEALSSIAAVSNVKIITKEAHAELGISLKIKNSSTDTETPIGCVQGTDITVTELFSTVPVRRKFLKAKETEWRHINLFMQAICANYYMIHCSLFHNGKRIFNYFPKASRIERIKELWDAVAVQHMLSIQTTDNHISIEGYISDHIYARYDRSSIFFFVNNRWIKNYGLTKALLKGYANVLPPGRYPASVLFITIDPELLDINVHPRKEEVLFLHPRKLEISIQNTVKKGLENALSKQIKKSVVLQQHSGMKSLDKSEDIYRNLSSPFSPISTNMTNTIPQPFPSFHQATSFHEKLSEKTFGSIIANQKTTDKQKEEKVTEKNRQKKILPKQSVIGIYKKTYILLEQAEGIMIIDQHAAHERILYELFTNRFDEVVTVSLIFPLLITLSQEELEIIEPYIDLFVENGIAIEIFGKNQLRISATPVYLKEQPLDDIVRHTITWIKNADNDQHKKIRSYLTKKLHAQMACKAAVKAGDTLSQEQIEKLIVDLQNTNNRFSCPHGRPTCWLLFHNDVEKKFKRVI
jgi:DNA mismatch repair protein MutL